MPEGESRGGEGEGAWREVLGAANCQSIQIHRHGHRMSVPIFIVRRTMAIYATETPSFPSSFLVSTPFVRDVLVILDNGLLSARLMLDACDASVDW